jgi:hypothetical protein
VLVLLDAGEEPGEGELTRLLRQGSCPGVLVERLAKCRWVVSSHRILQLVVRHPRCPRAFAWDALPRLGWHDLLEVGRDPRTPPAIRKQAERKLVERIVNLTLGERTALARQATRGLIGILLTDEQPLCVEALLSNPQFTETEALRLLNTNRKPGCVLVLLRHPVWGRRPEVLRAAVRRSRVSQIRLRWMASCETPPTGCFSSVDWRRARKGTPPPLELRLAILKLQSDGPVREEHTARVR